MGGVFIDLTPPWLKDLAIATFGTNDKLALFISIGVVPLSRDWSGCWPESRLPAASACIVLLAIGIGGACFRVPQPVPPI